MLAPKHRVVIDTNLWISFLLTKDLARLDWFFTQEELTLLFSQELLDEFVAVARRPKFRNYFSLLDLQELLLQVETKADFVRVSSTVELCRDPNDNFLLALDGHATHLLTGDQDLLVLGQLNQIPILSIAEYLARLPATP